MRDIVNPRFRSYDFWQKIVIFRESLISPLFSHMWLYCAVASAHTAAREPPEQLPPCWWKPRERGACEIVRAGHRFERWTSKLHPCNRGLPSHFCFLCLLLAFCTSRSPSNDAASSRNWHCLDAISDRTHLRPLYKHFRFWQTGVKNAFLGGAQDKHHESVPCVLNLPACSLEWMPHNQVSDETWIEPKEAANQHTF